jgi:toxin FitB
MKYILDTCVISEIIKSGANENVLAWISNQNEEDLFLSILTFGEIEKGIAKLSNDSRKKKLKLWVEDDLKKRFNGRILPIDLLVANQWGVSQGKAELAGKPMPVIDGLIAATGIAYKCIVVTRNTVDMQQSGVELLNPWLKIA